MPRFFSHPVRSIRRRKQSYQSRKGNKKSHKRSNRRSHTRKQQGGISEEPYQSHRIDVTFGGGQIFTFYTDCRTDRIRDIKTELLRKEKFAGATLETIVLFDLNGIGAVRNDDELITEPLNLRVIVGDHLLGAFRNVTAAQVNGSVSLPTQQERDAYEHAIAGTEDDVYTYEPFQSGNAFMFYSRQDQKRPKFLIANENTARLGHRIVQFYNQEKSWYTVRSPYTNNDIAPSDPGASLIYREYRKPGQFIEMRIDGFLYEYFNVNKLNNNIFTYVSKRGTGPISYVVGIPNKDILTFEESVKQAMKEIQPFLH